MINEWKNSFGTYVNERVNSPLYGTFTLTWIIWNWKLLYFLLFIDISEIPFKAHGIRYSRIEYIEKFYSDPTYTLTGPFISTIVLISIIPFLSNAAYFVTLRFRQWRLEQKQVIEKKQLLTLEESVNIRLNIESQNNRYANIMQEKENEIAGLKLLSDELNNKIVTNQASYNDEKDKYLKTIEKYDTRLKQFGVEFDPDNFPDPQTFVTIKSPIIGTFYRRVAPDKPNFVEIGSKIKRGDVLCVIEAMKLFNEIESELNGTIVRILVDDMSPVEFDQPLFLLDPNT